MIALGRICWDRGQTDAAIEHYRAVLTEARDAGVAPWVCLHHFTLPGWFTELGEGAFCDDRARSYHWARHVAFCAEAFGDLVFGWKPINEPFGYAALSYQLGVLPPGLKGWALPVQELPNQQRDVARAKALLQKAGYTGRVSMKLRNIVGFPALAAAVPVIVDNLKEAGVDVAVETVDGGVWIKDWIVPQSPPTMNEWGGFVDPDQALHRHFHSPPGGKDFRRWKNAQADELLDIGRTTLDRAKRKEVYDRVQRLMAEDPITIPLYSPDLLYVMQKGVSGFQPHPTGFYYGLRFASLER